MGTNKKRKEISIDADTLSILEILSKKEGRTLKNYLEHIVKFNADQFKLTDDYKVLMDEMLLKHENGELEYIDENTFRQSIPNL